MGRDAFAAPGKAELFGCGGFDRDLRGVEPHDFGHDGAHLRGVRADFGDFADQGAIGIGDVIAVFAGQIAGVAEEDVAGRAFPLWIRGGEVLADVAHRKGAVDGVGDGVHADVGVRVALEAACVGDGEAAECDVIAGAKAVDVVTVADAHIGVFLEEGFCAIEIGGVGEFEVGFIALGDGDGDAVGAGDFDVVGGGAREGRVGGADGVGVETLGGLGAVEAGAVLGAGDLGGLARLRAVPKRVAQRQGRGRGGGRLEGRDDLRDNRGADKRAGGVVDQDGVGGDRREAIGNRGLAGRAAVDYLDAVGEGVWNGGGLSGDHKDDLGDRGMRRETVKGVQGHGAAAKVAPLFGHPATHASALASGDDDGGGCHGRPLRLLRDV